MRFGSKGRWAAGLWLALTTASAVVAAPQTSPKPAVIAWSTYLRERPDETSMALAELEHDTPVEVVGCSDRWCQVSGAGGSGYVDRDALTLPRTLAPVPPATTNCVVVGQADNRGPIPTKFCSAPGRH